MALTYRQTRAFTDTVDVYAPKNFSKTSKRVTSGVTYGPDATDADVKCHIESSIDASVPGPIGRQSYDIVQTLDVIRFVKTQTIGAGFYVHLKTSGHPEYGSWYVVQGDARNHVWRAAERVLFMKKTTKPPGIA